MDDLDRIVLEVAVTILEAEAEDPGSQPSSSIKLAEQILAQLEQTGGEQPKWRRASGS